MERQWVRSNGQLERKFSLCFCYFRFNWKKKKRGIHNFILQKIVNVSLTFAPACKNGYAALLRVFVVAGFAHPLFRSMGILFNWFSNSWCLAWLVTVQPESFSIKTRAKTLIKLVVACTVTTRRTAFCQLTVIRLVMPPISYHISYTLK